MKPARKAPSLWFGPALLAAGLLLSAGHLRADAVPTASVSAPAPGRSIAPAGDSDSSQALSPSAAAPAAGQDFAADLDEQDSRLRAMDRRLREQDGLLQDQAQRLSGVAGALDDASVALSAGARAQERLVRELDAVSDRVQRLESKSLSLEEGQATAAVSASSSDARQQQLALDLAALKKELANNTEALASGLKELKATRESLARLDSLAELLGMVKRDEESNDEELVEMKQTLQSLEPSPSSPNAAWWDAVLSWKYLPAVATGIGVVALGVAAFNH
ncbi:MAG TPA: hypothetical protein VK914_06140 [bacterium]|jgi:hypothetical protein|nr:hypothetical protein [bacterium]